jgi:hypothetical protein
LYTPVQYGSPGGYGTLRGMWETFGEHTLVKVFKLPRAVSNYIERNVRFIGGMKLFKILSNLE